MRRIPLGLLLGTMSLEVSTPIVAQGAWRTPPAFKGELYRALRMPWPSAVGSG